MEQLFMSVREKSQIADTIHQDIAHTDLSGVVRIVEDGRSRPMTLSDLQRMRLTDEEAIEIAQQYTDAMPVRMATLGDVLGDMLPAQDGIMEDALPAEKQVYLLSVGTGPEGAAVLTRPEALEEVRKQLNDDIVILPSSVHEVLLMRAQAAPPVEELENMVQEINRTVVAQEDRLSDRVYIFDGRLSLMRDRAAVKEQETGKELAASKSEGISL